MLHTFLRKRAHVITLIVVLSILLTAMTALAASKLIVAKKGGTIDLAPGVKLVIPPKALEEDTVISADMRVKKKRITYDFGPSGTVFSKPAELIISSKVFKKAHVDDLVLYGEDGETIEPIRKKKSLVYEINHFSAYYHRRR